MNAELLERAKALKLYGLIAHWDSLDHPDWLEPLLSWEEEERQRRSLERRLRNAHLGRFKPIADFDWDWPDQCDRAIVEEWLSLEFLNTAANAVLLGPNGVGKSTIAANIAYQAVLQGHTVIFISAADLLNELAAQDSERALRLRIKHYAKPQLLCIDEVGYLSYGNRHADLLFQIISRRYEQHSTLITTNRPFVEWGELFPNAACVVSLVDRLVHNAEILTLDGESFRLKEAREREELRRQRRPKRPPKKKTNNSSTSKTKG